MICVGPYLLAVVVVLELARYGVLSEMLNADDFVFMSETVAVPRNKYRKRDEVLKDKGL